MQKTVDLIFAHPYPDRSRANRVLLRAVSDLAFVEVRSLYDRYPDFAVDKAAEQEALASAELVVWQHPMYWYTVPSLLKLWWEKVLERRWAYGPTGTKLHGKKCLWVVTTGGDERAFSPEGIHAHTLAAFTPVVEQTARFCGMEFLEPIVVNGAHRVPEKVLEDHARDYRSALLAFEPNGAAR